MLSCAKINRIHCGMHAEHKEKADQYVEAYIEKIIEFVCIRAILNVSSGINHFPLGITFQEQVV